MPPNQQHWVSPRKPGLFEPHLCYIVGQHTKFRTNGVLLFHNPLQGLGLLLLDLQIQFLLTSVMLAY